MTLCKFYQQGNCKFGNSCRFEHAARNQPPSRFGALAAGAAGAGGNGDALAKYNISTDVIEKDLTVDKPQWILSAYAPGRDAPEQLFGGYPREQSFEELRLHYMVGKASGNERQALEEAQSLYGNARQQMEAAVRNVHEAARFMAEGENRHPNRHDVCRERTQGAPFGEFLVGRRPRPMSNAQANPFASGASASSAFGQPASSYGQPPGLPNPFGAPAFGQPAQPAVGIDQPPQPSSGFGQPPPPASSPFGPPSHGAGSAFGQGAQPTSAFGQPSALGAKPNPFGAPAFGQPAQPSTQGNTAAFGQPSQLGHKPNPFAPNATTTGADPNPFSTIGTTGNSGNNNTPAANPFGPPSSSQAVTPNPFSTYSTKQNSNAFGQAAQPSVSSFTQASTPASNPFASATQQQVQEPFAQKSQTNGAFGRPASHPPGQSAAQNAAQNAANPFGQQPGVPQAMPSGAPQAQQKPAAASTGNPYPPGSTRQHPPLESYSSRSMDGRLAMFKGKPVTYKDGVPGNRAFDGTWTRIWFPDGPPAYCTDTELPPESYDEKSKAQWEAFVRTGTFADGVMPELPPPRECTLWDF